MLSGIALLDDELTRLDPPLVDAVDDLAHLRRVEVFEKVVVHDCISNHLLRPAIETHDEYRCSAAEWVKSRERGRRQQVTIFQLTAANFPTEEITGAPNFNFAPIILENRGFSPKFCISDKGF